MLIAQAGCASHQGVQPVVSPSLTSIAALGRTGVAASWGASDLRLAEPPKGRTGGFARGAAYGAGVTVGGGLAVGSVVPTPLWTLGWTAIGVALAPIGALVGGIAVAGKALPPEQVERGKASLVDALTAVDLPATLRDDVIRLGSEQSWHTLVRMPEGKPEPGDREIGTVLQLVIRHVGLEGRMESGKPVSVWVEADPGLELRVKMDAALIKASDDAVLYTRSFEVFGPERKFSAWASDDGRGFREALLQVSADLASQVANALFPPPPP